MIETSSGLGLQDVKNVCNSLPMTTTGNAADIITNSPELLEEARGWVIDAYDVDPELYNPSAALLIRTIERGYVGGAAEFVRNSSALITN